MYGKVAAALGPVYLGLHLFKEGLGFATHALNTMQNPYTSQLQKERSLTEAIPVVGGVMKSLYEFKDAISGTTTALLVVREQLREDMGKIEQRIGERQQVDTAARGGRTAAARVQADREIGFNPTPFKGDVFDERARREHEIMQPHELRVTQARRGVRTQEILKGQIDKDVIASRADVAAKEAVMRRANLDLRREEVKAVDPAQKKAEPAGPAGPASPFAAAWSAFQVTGGPVARGATIAAPGVGGHAAMQLARDDANDNRVPLAKAHAAHEKAVAELLGAQAMMKERVNAQGQIGVDLANAQKAAAAAVLEQDRARLGILQQTEQRMRGQQLAIGGMHAGQVALLKATLEQAGKHGVKNLVPQQHDILRQAGLGQRVDKELLHAAQDDPEKAAVMKLAREFNQERPEDIAAGLKGVAAKVVALKANVEVRLDADTQQLNAGIAKAMKELTEEIVKLVKAQGEAQRARLQGDNIFRRLLGGGGGV